MRKLLFLVTAVIVVLGFVKPAMAQSDTDFKWELAGGYTFTYDSVSVGGETTTDTARVVPNVTGGGDPTETFNFNGGGGEIEYKFSHALGFLAELGGAHTGSNFSDLNTFSYLFGPRLHVGGGKYTYFVEPLFGGIRGCDDGFCQNAFNMFIGGGVDVNLTDHLFFRPIEAGYELTKFNFGGNNDIQNGFRYTVGVGWRF